MIRGSMVLEIWPQLLGAPPVIAEIGGVAPVPRTTAQLAAVQIELILSIPKQRDDRSFEESRWWKKEGAPVAPKLYGFTLAKVSRLAM